jgi:hypothetical protein
MIPMQLKRSNMTKLPPLRRIFSSLKLILHSRLEISGLYNLGLPFIMHLKE